VRLLFYNLDVAKHSPPRVQRTDRSRGGAMDAQRVAPAKAGVQKNMGSHLRGNDDAPCFFISL
jgi:hypothetical protein